MTPRNGGARPGVQAGAALMAVVCFVGFAAGFVALHALRSDLDPLAHFGSEYALGSYGWLMDLNFALMGAGLLLAAEAVVGELPARRRGATAGALLLAAAAVSFFVDIFFQTDPLGAPATDAGNIHSGFGLIIFISIPAAAGVLTRSYWSEPRWKDGRTNLGLLSAGCVAAFFAFLPLGADGLAGLGQRLALAFYVPWLALFVLKLRSEALAASDPAVASPTADTV